MLFTIGMVVILVGMQLDFAYHVTTPFESYISIQHFVIYVGVGLIGMTAVSRYTIRKILKIPIDVSTKLALAGFALMIGAGFADYINHEFIIQGFDSLFSWSHVPFEVGTVVIAIAVFMALRRTWFSAVGWTVIILSTMALTAVSTIHGIPDDWTPVRPFVTWSAVIITSIFLAKKLG